ncbi:VirK family protein [Bradyrhizobium sp. NC92]|uniref:VirK family protein n=1 Tax=Bradyrhizobium sp. (strain NC92) TaxID=55395 RepID=UPI0021A9D615|nr:VirK family protein [Bradyrhizobium sp. NC92]UWU67754.1 VirK family protein [Bradyrhizobium sp. NC92]
MCIQSSVSPIEKWCVDEVETEQSRASAQKNGKWFTARHRESRLVPNFVAERSEVELYRTFRNTRLSIAVSLIAAVSVSTLVKADEPSPKYIEVLNALQAGKNVRVVMDLSRCTVADGGKPGPATQGGLAISAFRVTPQNGISFANTHQTLDSSGRAVTEYIRHNLSREGKLTVRASKLVVGTVDVVNQGEFVCELPEGAKFMW